MSLEVDYLPVATAGGANVDSQANFVGSGYQTEGFQAGLAQSKQLNKVWRQSSMMAAALANFIANTLGINVLDDGNISALITNLTNAILRARLVNLNITPVLINSPLNIGGNLMTYTIPAGFLNSVGKTIRLEAMGSIQPATAETVSLQLSGAGGGANAATVGFSAGIGAPIGWRSKTIITCVTTGGTGTINMSSQFSVDYSSSISSVTNQGANFQLLSLNLTNAITLTFFSTFSVLAANISSQNELLVEALN